MSRRSFSQSGGVRLRGGGTFVFNGAGGLATGDRCFVLFFFTSMPLLYIQCPAIFPCRVRFP
jgi:hypothetical protein